MWFCRMAGCLHDGRIEDDDSGGSELHQVYYHRHGHCERHQTLKNGSGKVDWTGAEEGGGGIGRMRTEV